jgi:hypothetical protein
MSKNLVEINCNYCNKGFLRKTYRIRPTNNFCSQICQRDFIHSLKRNSIEDFWSKVDKTPGYGPNGDCWNWRGYIHSRFGYGVFSFDGKQQRANRLSFMFSNGVDPKDLCVCHSCDNRKCVNPAHLWLGTYKDNTQDMISKGRNSRGEDRPLAKRTEKDILKIIELYKDGMTPKKISDTLGINLGAVGKVLHRKSWTYLTKDLVW